MKKTLTKKYFDDVYAASDDPWNFTESEYEARKYALTLENLDDYYENVLEIGCSIGVLTEKLAARCRRLLAVDISEKALAAARRRCENLPQVEFRLTDVSKEFPVENFDLILVSEVGYYLNKSDWAEMTQKIINHTRPNGQIALVHWLPFVHDYPQTGDETHENFAALAAAKMTLEKAHREEKFRLDVWRKKV